MKQNNPARVKAHVTSRAKNTGTGAPAEFLKWYAEVRMANTKVPVHFVEGGDGGCDVIIENPSRIVIAQCKFGTTSYDKVQSFANVIRAWADKASFRDWMSGVKSKAARKVYERMAADNRPIRWEFVTLSGFVDTWKNCLVSAARMSHARFSADLVFGDYLAYLLEIRSTGARFSESLVVPHDGKYIPYHHENGMETQIWVLRIPQLLSAISKHDDVDSLFARNVRLEVRNSPVNGEIAATYEKMPKRFFFGNNGVHVVCVRANVDGPKLYLEQPAIINGGQTVRTLLKSKNQHADGKIMVRVTVIPHEFQATEDGRRFVDDIIFMSNNNNRMEPWNLRSNDPVQVQIAEYLLSHDIFYERKDFEWEEAKVRYEPGTPHIKSKELAQVWATCSDGINPAHLKMRGINPLFSVQKPDGKYEEIFVKGIVRSLDEAVSMARLYSLLKKWLKEVPGLPQDFGSFPAASLHFTLGLMWRSVDRLQISHPLNFRIRGHQPSPALGRIARLTTKALFDVYRHQLETGKTTQNDIFRNNAQWELAKRRILTKSYSVQVSKALAKDSKK